MCLLALNEIDKASFLPYCVRLCLRSFHRALQQPPRRKHNAVQPDFTLEELKEMENDPEATDKDDEENTEA